MDEKIVFFDGECSFCGAWVNFVLRWEREPKFKFCASQSNAAKAHLSASQQKLTESTVLFLERGKLYEKSTAVLRIYRYLRWFWVLGYLGFLVPRFIRDAVYDFIARHRRSLFPKGCQLSNDRERFLE